VRQSRLDPARPEPAHVDADAIYWLAAGGIGATGASPELIFQLT